MMSDKNSSKPLVLLTNDDGYDSPAIIELAAQLIDEFEIFLVAPLHHHSGAGRSIPFGASYDGSGTIHRHTIEVSPGKNLTVYAVEGTPALCVAHAVLEIVPRKPDLCISGINFGENLAQGLHYSGTVGAAMEAAAAGIPTLAVSREMELEDVFNYQGQREMFTSAARIVRKMALHLVQSPMESDFMCLNVNIPSDATIDTQIEIAHQSRQNRWEWSSPAGRELGKPFQLVCENNPDIKWEPGSDAFVVLNSRHISVTPLTFSMEARAEETDTVGLELFTKI